MGILPPLFFFFLCLDLFALFIFRAAALLSWLDSRFWRFVLVRDLGFLPSAFWDEGWGFVVDDGDEDEEHEKEKGRTRKLINPKTTTNPNTRNYPAQSKQSQTT